jgi:hypothetical protein
LAHPYLLSIKEAAELEKLLVSLKEIVSRESRPCILSIRRKRLRYTKNWLTGIIF